MGQSFSSAMYYIFPKQKKRIIMFGLDGAGKTTLLYQHKLKQEITAVPTISFNVETIDFKNHRWTIWDFVGSESIRRKFTHYLPKTDAIIFVVDSADVERIGEAEMALTDMFWCDDLKGVPILLLANKQDVPNALSPEEVAERMKMKSRNHDYHVEGVSSANLIDGLEGAFEHLRTMLSRPKKLCS